MSLVPRGSARASRPSTILALLLAALSPAIAIQAVSAATVAVAPAAAGVVEEIALINADRTSAGLVAYETDARLMAIASQRARTMAATGVFSHAGPDGRSAFDMIEAAGMTWYGAGEVIAWNTWSSLLDSARAANDGWMASELHRELLLSTDDNYIGVGVATTATGTTYWSAIVMSGPDRTGAWARLGSATLSRLATGLVVRFTWSGGDVPLQVMTSGLRDFQVQRRTDGGAWYGVTSSTSLRAWALRVVPGHRYEFRVRARDRAGNLGTWTMPVGVGT